MCLKLTNQSRRFVKVSPTYTWLNLGNYKEKTMRRQGEFELRIQNVELKAKNLIEKICAHIDVEGFIC